MRDKGSPKIALAFLLLFTVLGSTLAFSPAPVFAQNPSCGDTITTNTTLTANLGPCSGNGLVVGANGVALDCAGHTITGEVTPGSGHSDFPSGPSGVSIYEASNVTVMNCVASDFTYGFHLVNSFNSTLKNNTATSNGNTYSWGSYGGAGFDLNDSSSNALSGNTANNNGGAGIVLESSSDHNTLTGNTAEGNAFDGLVIYTGSSFNTIRGNTAGNNGLYGVYLAGGASSNSLDQNTANGNSIAGFYVYDESDDNYLRGNNASGDYYGFFIFGDSDGNTLMGNVADGMNSGFIFQSSSFNTLSMNTADGNTESGFYIDSSSMTNVLNNNTADRNGFRTAPGYVIDGYGYVDDSLGPGAAGTDNTYRSNECSGNGARGSSPSGLCLASVSLSPSLGSVGASVTITGAYFIVSHGLTTTYDGSATGMPTFCSTNSSGDINVGCTFTVPPSSVLGPHTITVSDGTSSHTTTFTVTLLGVTCSRSSVVVGSATTCKATVHESGTKAPTGKVTWSSSGSGTFLKASCKLSRHKSYSTCSVKFTPTAPGSSVVLTANYGGDSNNPATAGAYNLIVTPKVTTTKVSCTPTSAVAGSPTVITCAVRVVGYLPTGTTTWSQSGTGSVSLSSTTCTLNSLKNPDLATCSVKMTGTTAGKVALQGTYSGDPNNLGSHRKAILTIKA